jgi:VWFA-related protein
MQGFGVLLVIAVASPFSTARQRLEDDSYRFRVDVDMVNFSVTVLDEKKRLRTGLEPRNFRVFEDGVEQKISLFSHEEVPLRMVILLDTSSSMRMKLPLAQKAAINFVRSLRPEDQVEITAFADRVLTLAPLSSDFEAMTQAIEETEAEGATALYNSIYVSLKNLAGGPRELARQAIVVLSDGADTRSLVSFEDVLALARKGDVLIYPISLRASKKDLLKDKYREARYALGELAEETGGLAFAPETINDLAGVYEAIATELKSQYSLGYVSTNTKADGGFRRVQILCDVPGAEVRTRPGYHAPRVSRAASPGRSRN